MSGDEIAARMSTFAQRPSTRAARPVLRTAAAPVIAALLFTALGLALALFVGATSQRLVDEPLLEDVQALTMGMTALTSFFNTLLRDFGIPILWALSMAWFAWARRWDMVALFAAGAFVGLANQELKALFDRPRPSGDFFVREFPGDSSFPSGHVMSAMAFFGLWWIVSPHLFGNGRATHVVRCAGAVAVLLTAVSRVWVGAHWPTDTLAGIAFGGAFVAILWALHQALTHHGPGRRFATPAHKRPNRGRPPAREREPQAVARLPRAERE